jgi:hypothetical protein
MKAERRDNGKICQHAVIGIIARQIYPIWK